jgi:hypothetical protein
MMIVMKETDKYSTAKSVRRKRGVDQRFSSYLSFGYAATICLGVFAWIYMILLLISVPLLFMRNDINDDPKLEDSLHPGGKGLLPLVHRLQQKIQMLPSKVRKQFDHFRTNKDLIDQHLINATVLEMNRLRKVRQENSVVTNESKARLPKSTGRPGGFIVLGMHRSGTSMLSGLLVTGLGYHVGEPLIGGAFDNEKGFFELLDVVLQNDVFMNSQKVWWSSNVLNYDNQKAAEIVKLGGSAFEHGRQALKFLNDPQNIPWLQKDPRMCITLPTWLPLLHTEPAVLFTYRHPMEVAHSLIKREASFTMDHALRLWVVYNMRALQNSQHLCRVYTSNDDVLNSPLEEVQRVSDELTRQCQVPRPPHILTQEQVNKFVDTSLQHNKKAADAGRTVIATHHEHCLVYELETETDPLDPQYLLEQKWYGIAMQIYCDLKEGLAYQSDYKWPKLN